MDALHAQVHPVRTASTPTRVGAHSTLLTTLRRSGKVYENGGEGRQVPPAAPRIQHACAPTPPPRPVTRTRAHRALTRAQRIRGPDFVAVLTP